MNSITVLNLEKGLSFACVLALALVSGCSPAGQEPPVAEEPVATVAPERDVEAESGKRTVPVGKPGAPVSMTHEYSARPELGSPVDITVLLTPGVAADSLSVSVTADESLVLQSPPQLAFTGAAAGSPLDTTVTVTPTAEGLAYVNVIVSMASAGRTQSRAFAIPVEVGDTVKRLDNKAAAMDATGTAVVSMPAEETTGESGKDGKE